MNPFFTNLFAGIKKFFGRGSKFQEILQLAVSNILNYAAPAAIDLLTSVAMAKVGEADGSGLTNAQKRDLVVKQLQAVAIKEGITASTAMINLIVETAVNATKVNK